LCIALLRRLPRQDADQTQKAWVGIAAWRKRQLRLVQQQGFEQRFALSSCHLCRISWGSQGHNLQHSPRGKHKQRKLKANIRRQLARVSVLSRSPACPGEPWRSKITYRNLSLARSSLASSPLLMRSLTVGATLSYCKSRYKSRYADQGDSPWPRPPNARNTRSRCACPRRMSQ